ncbi:YesL family protein [Anaerocolumna sp.]|uniref:YesL family protein n=1 Tax=Anaerocolumna sp. TaxID=2041569 RepID=UPI0028AFF8C9|nr:DUF624 domain-containing protein [Anaerocolumna sp.]
MLKNLFNPENSFWEFMTNMTNILFVGLIWLICCIPIITIGASTTALYDYTLKMADNREGYVLKSFFKTFKNNFVKSTLLWIFMLLGAGFLVIDGYICLRMGTQTGKFLFFAIAAIGIMYFIICVYLFPVLAYFQMNVKEVVKNACIMGVGNLPITILIIIILAIGGLIIYTAPYFIFALVSFAAYVSSFCYLSVFRKFVNAVETDVK